MISIPTFKKIILSFSNVTEESHFEKTSFRVNKKIIATLNIKENRATLKLSLTEQDLFCIYDKNVMYPVPNKWGKQGWTHVKLKTIPLQMCKEALYAAYCEVTKTKLPLKNISIFNGNLNNL